MQKFCGVQGHVTRFSKEPLAAGGIFVRTSDDRSGFLESILKYGKVIYQN